VSTHYTEDELTLYYYGEGRRREAIERHLESCSTCAPLYREIAGTLAMIAAPDVPDRDDQYGLEVWQHIRHKLPDRDAPWWRARWTWLPQGPLALAAGVATLVLVAFLAGRTWQREPAGTPQASVQVPGTPDSAAASGDVRHRILLTSVADHLDRSDRMLTDIMNAADRRDISAEQRWADDLLIASRLYRQDAVDAGEQSVAVMLDELERSLLEIVHSPSPISAVALEQLRRRIDAAALLFKVRVMSDELRQREQTPADRSLLRSSTRKTS
jgi:hypothetical protein